MIWKRGKRGGKGGKRGKREREAISTYLTTYTYT